MSPFWIFIGAKGDGGGGDNRHSVLIAIFQVNLG